MSAPDDVDGGRGRAAAPRQRQGHQQRGQELAGDVATNGHGRAGGGPRRADRQRRKSFLRQIADVAAQRSQAHRRDRRSDVRASAARRTARSCRPAPQAPRSAGETRCPRSRGTTCRRGSETRRRTGHHAGSLAALTRNVDAEGLQRIDHSVGVVGGEHIDQRRRTLRQRRQQQRAIGNALRPWQRDDAFGMRDRRKRELRRKGDVHACALRRHPAQPLSSTTGCARFASHARRAVLALSNSADNAAPSPAAMIARAPCSASP